jgi:hypothetical protein
MNAIKCADFMRILERLQFEDKHLHPLADRIQTGYVDHFGLEPPGLAVILPKSELVAEWFYALAAEELGAAYGEVSRRGRRVNTELDMVLYFPGVTLED